MTPHSFRLRSIHGLGNSKLYYAWHNMKSRCYNIEDKRYKDYGGRGIKVCERWHSFYNFYTDNNHLCKTGLALDRIDNNGDYCKENCRWVTREVQQNNMRTNRILTYNGMSMTIAQWASKLNLKITTIHSRLERGWSETEALSTPLRINQHM